VQNCIGEALFHRICNAITNNETLRVIVVLPVWPGFEGEVETSVAIQAVLHWQYLSISRGGKSLLERLLKIFPEPVVRRYIGFYALRNHATLNGTHVTEQIYVHRFVDEVCPAVFARVSFKHLHTGTQQVDDRGRRHGDHGECKHQRQIHAWKP